jgi:hypothetical protein
LSMRQWPCTSRSINSEPCATRWTTMGNTTTTQPHGALMSPPEQNIGHQTSSTIV